MNWVETIAPCGRLEAQKDPDNRRLSGSIASQQAIDAALGHAQMDAVQDTPPVEVFDEVFNYDCFVVRPLILYFFGGLNFSAAVLNHSSKVCLSICI